MSRKRRVLFLTEAAFSTIKQAMGYVRDQNDVGDGDGDVSDQWAKANENVLAAIGKAPTRDVHADTKALRSVLQAALENSCSCPGPDSATGVDRGGKLHKPSGHCNDCWAATHHNEVERVRTLLAEMDKSL